MIRQEYSINNFKYICDLYNDEKIAVYNQFVMLRQTQTIDSVVYDTDIFLIPLNIYNEIKESGSNITDKYVFINNLNNYGLYSSSYSNYDDILNNDLFNLIDEGGLVTPLVNKDNEYVNIKCNKLKIYHPANKIDLDYIIHVDNIINDINFHYICQLNKNYITKSEEDFKVNNNSYSEYIEVFIPDLDFLFNEKNYKSSTSNNINNYNVYFKDIYNINKYLDDSNKISKDIIEELEDIEYTPLGLLKNPFMCIDGEKIYYNISYQDFINYVSYPLNVTLYPYKKSEEDNLYLLSSDYNEDNNTYIFDYKFKLNANIKFIDGALCINSYFDYPYKEKHQSLQEAYATYNNLHVEWIEFDESTGEGGYWDCKEYKDVKSLELDVDDYEEIKCCGYKIEIASSLNSKVNIKSEYIELPFIDDFAFNLVGIIKNWKSSPDGIICKISFIDKFLGLCFESNSIVVNKELIKYIINEDTNNTVRLKNEFVNNQNNLNDMSWNTKNAKDTSFNFINSINCIVKKNEDNNNTTNHINNENIKYIYKPIFYRTSTLQNLLIKEKHRQKVGINLSNYASKVNLFKLELGGYTYTEFGRNDVYVIFDIDANSIQLNAGNYNILDENNNFISDGKYTIVQ